MTYTFATRTRFHGAPVVLIGSGDTEEAALRDALDRDLGIDYRDHDGYHMTRTVNAGEIHALVPSASTRRPRTTAWSTSRTS